MYIHKNNNKKQRDIIINPSEHLPVISSHQAEKLEKTGRFATESRMQLECIMIS